MTTARQMIVALVVVAVVSMAGGTVVGWAHGTTTYGHESCWFETRSTGERIILCARSGLPRSHEADTFPQDNPQPQTSARHRCPEDAVLVWDGTTNTHTNCVTLDDFTDRRSIDRLDCILAKRGHLPQRPEFEDNCLPIEEPVGP